MGALLRGQKLDPIELDNACYGGHVAPEVVLLDGHHRLIAHALIGRARIDCRYGGRVDLLRYLEAGAISSSAHESLSAAHRFIFRIGRLCLAPHLVVLALLVREPVLVHFIDHVAAVADFAYHVVDSATREVLLTLVIIERVLELFSRVHVPAHAWMELVALPLASAAQEASRVLRTTRTAKAKADRLVYVAS